MMTARGVQVSSGLMAMSITSDVQMQGLRQPEGTFKEMEEITRQLGIGEIPWILWRPSYTLL